MGICIPEKYDNLFEMTEQLSKQNQQKRRKRRAKEKTPKQSKPHTPLITIKVHMRKIYMLVFPSM